ncbi:MAG TPA: hypothetical protein VH985_19620, partial [Candidatus Binatia bacterium]
ALNTWICVIVRRAALAPIADAAGFDALDTGTVAPIAFAAMSFSRGNLREEFPDYALTRIVRVDCAVRWRRTNIKIR